MKFGIQLSSGAIKFLRKLDKETGQRIIKKIEELKIEPLLRETKKITGSESIFRVRVGNYRILYEVDFATGIIGIVKIDHRDKIYRN